MNLVELVGDDIMNIIYNYQYQMEHKEKYNKCLGEMKYFMRLRRVEYEYTRGSQSSQLLGISDLEIYNEKTETETYIFDTFGKTTINKYTHTDTNIINSDSDSDSDYSYEDSFSD